MFSILKKNTLNEHGLIISVSDPAAVSFKCRRVDPHETAAVFLLRNDGLDKKYYLLGRIATDSEVNFHPKITLLKCLGPLSAIININLSNYLELNLIDIPSNLHVALF